MRLHRTSRKRLHNRVVGDIELTGNALELPGDELTLIAYTADPGSPAEDQLRLLASWAATRIRHGARPDPGATQPPRLTIDRYLSVLPPTSAPERNEMHHA